MGRLIEEDKLMQDVNNTITEKSGAIDWINLINRQPTAYDPDKVVKQLEKCAKGNCVRNSDSGRCPYIGNSEIDCEKCAMLRAIEIVKAGGVDA